MIDDRFMRIITDAELLQQVEGFLSRTSMPHTRFGRETMSDGALVQHLRAGRSLSLANANKVLDFMATYQGAREQEIAA
jgi:hypothetical protein